jgi:DNA-binding transcriptional ArsR family regulator
MRQLDDAGLEHVARYFGALAVPVRLRILNALREGEINVGELTLRVGSTQANVSKHLAVLMQHGLVQRSSRGTSAFYRIADPATYELCDLVCGQIEKRLVREAVLGKIFSGTARASGKRLHTRGRTPGRRR